MRHKFIQKITAYGVQLRQGYWCLKRQFQQYLSEIVDTFYSCLKSSVPTICFGKTVANKFNLAGFAAGR
jgi:hypothetical protein